MPKYKERKPAGPQTEEGRQRISDALKKRWADPQQRAQQVAKMNGRGKVNSIKTLRLDLGQSQSVFAATIGLAPTNPGRIWQLENGCVPTDNMIDLMYIAAQAAGIEWEYVE